METFSLETHVYSFNGAEVASLVEPGALANLCQHLADVELDAKRVFIITDSVINELYGECIAGILRAGGIEYKILILPSGEEHKTLAQAARLIEELSDAGAVRSDLIVAFGGGVVGDLGGFVASVYNRGLPLVHVPTSLLAMVDSSIGGKTGVDHGGKNKTGTFYQPKLVVADPELLKTLSPRIYTEAFGEIIKYGMLNSDFLGHLESHAEELVQYSDQNLPVLCEVISRCVALKASFTTKDQHETSQDGRILLNYGHTFGHALEAAGKYKELLHGEAVAIGMTFAAQLAVTLGIARPELLERQSALLNSFGLPTSYDGVASLKEIVNHITKDKKNLQQAKVRFVLPKGFGKMIVKELSIEQVTAVITEFLS